MSVIYALSSAPGRAAVAVLRLSGSGALSIGARIAGDLPPARRAALRRLRRGDGETLDQALVIAFPGPNSATGEDMVELHTHGSRAVLAAVLAELSSLEGCRLAEPGEFSRRAFLNGKRDLAGLEGLADLIDAETEGQRRQALRQLDGTLGALVTGWRSELLEVQAELEAELDFSDEGDVATDLGRARRAIAGVASALAEALRGADAAERVREGFRVVIAGPPNAGKSTLLNALAQREVAIVTAVPGTTRDVLDVELDLHGHRVIVSDTAGIRTAEDEVEAEGVRRARARMDDADLVVWLDEASPVASAPAGALAVLSKADRFAAGSMELEGVAISARTGYGMEALVRRLSAAADACVGSGDSALVVRRRHRDAINEARDALDASAATDLPEVIAEFVRRARFALGRISGAEDPEQVLDAVFGRFCIGK